MQSLQMARITDGSKTWVVVSVPIGVLESPMKSAYVIGRAQHDFGCDILLTERGSGRIAGDPAGRSPLLNQDIRSLPWSEWNMAEEDD